VGSCGSPGEEGRIDADWKGWISANAAVGFDLVK